MLKIMDSLVNQQNNEKLFLLKGRVSNGTGFLFALCDQNVHGSYLCLTLLPAKGGLAPGISG
jgi:hypothetical protein